MRVTGGRSSGGKRDFRAEVKQTDENGSRLQGPSLWPGPTKEFCSLTRQKSNINMAKFATGVHKLKIPNNFLDFSDSV